jgi:hypothetical protein
MTSPPAWWSFSARLRETRTCPAINAHSLYHYRGLENGKCKRNQPSTHLTHGRRVTSCESGSAVALPFLSPLLSCFLYFLAWPGHRNRSRILQSRRVQAPSHKRTPPRDWLAPYVHEWFRYFHDLSASGGQLGTELC